jgi:hypothetical protein
MVIMFKLSFVFLLLFSLFTNHCNKSNEKLESTEATSSESKKAMSPMSAKMESGAEMEERNFEDKDSVSEPNIDIGKPLNPITDATKSRMLEYNIHLRYKIESIPDTRKKILEVVKKNSYIKSSSTSINSEKIGSLQLEIQTPVEKMYDTLLDLDKLGALIEENIYTIDHTESNEWQKIQIIREELRSSRRSKATASGKAENWTWKDREELLEKSEDNLDQAKFETWKIKDKVNWAKLNITFAKNDNSIGIEFPSYKDYFINSINFLLSLTAYLIYLIPISILLGLIYYLVQRFRN